MRPALLLPAVVLCTSTAASAADRSVELRLEGPGEAGQPEVLPLPATLTRQIDGDKTGVRLVLDAAADGDDVKIKGQLFEVKGEKAKPVRSFELLLPDPGVPGVQRSEWLTPKGYTPSSGSIGAMLVWKVTASWDEAVPAPAWTPGPASDLPVGPFALLQQGAALYAGPADAAPVGRVGFASDSAEVFRPTGAADGGRIEVEAPPRVAGAWPSGRSPAIAGSGIRLWVEPAALVPVTAAAVDALAADGSQLRLRSGVPLSPIEGGGQGVRVGPLLVPLAAAPALADRFSPTDAPPVRAGDAKQIVARQGKGFGAVAAGEVRVDVLGTPEMAAPGRADELRVTAVPVGARFAVTGPEGEAVVRVRPDLERKPAPAAAPVEAPRRDGPSLPAGTALSWPDGRPAGVTAEPLPLPAKVVTEKGRSCGLIGGDGGMRACW